MDTVLASPAYPSGEVKRGIAGVDEAGRGCLAGPVLAACVVLPEIPLHPLIRDSKKLTPAQRETVCRWLYRYAPVISVALSTVEEIERLNILHASLLAMRRALEACPLQIDKAYIDGNCLPDVLPCPAEAVINGDESVPVISAASIVAKVIRDHLMMRLHRVFPQYGFAQHKGYATALHRQAIQQYGLCPQHRPSFCTNILCLPFGGGNGL